MDEKEIVVAIPNKSIRERGCQSLQGLVVMRLAAEGIPTADKQPVCGEIVVSSGHLRYRHDTGSMASIYTWTKERPADV